MEMSLLSLSILLFIVGFIFFILSIRLFFKIWDMTNDVAIIRKMMETDRKMSSKAEADEKAEEANEHKDDVGVEVKNGYKSVVQSDDDDDGINRVVKMFIIILILFSIVFLLVISD